MINGYDTDDGDVDQLHQARHIPDHLPLKHLKHDHIDDGARRYALEFSIFRGFQGFFCTWNIETIICESELDSSEIAIPMPMPIGLRGTMIKQQRISSSSSSRYYYYYGSD